MEKECIKKEMTQGIENEICMEFDAISENEGLARVVIAAFLSRIDPTVDEIEDVKTAVSEAVTNAVIHGYGEGGGRVVMRARLSGEKELAVDISDRGGEQRRRRDLRTYVETFWRRTGGVCADPAGGSLEQKRQGVIYGGEGTFYQGTAWRKGGKGTVI